MKETLVKTREIEETEIYWKDLIPKIWPTLSSKCKALERFESQLRKKNYFNSRKSIEARIAAFKILIEQQRKNVK